MHRSRTKFFGALAALLIWVGSVGAEPLDLPAIKDKGVIRIALYKDYPPYSANNGGIDYEVAGAIAKKLGVRLDPIWFEADENVDDDLRNMVWKGHYLGVGPADAMIHAPIDPELARRNDRVKLVAPYYRDKLELVRDVERLPQIDDMSFLKDMYIGAEEASLASIVLLSIEGGRYRDRIRHYKNATLAIAAMQRGEVVAVLGQHGEVQGLSKGEAKARYSQLPLPGALVNRQWVVGVAVKANHDALAKAIETAMTELAAEGELEKIFARYGVAYLKP